MGRLEELIKEETKGLSPILLNYSEDLPPGIAQRCGAEEVADVMRMLDELSKERISIEAGDESWDGDAIDDIWRAQKRLTSLLPHFMSKYPTEVISGLESDYLNTRMWVASAIEKRPVPQAIPVLRQVLAGAKQDLEKRVVESALRHCLAIGE